MRKKSLTIWALTSITFISLIHLIEAIAVITLNNPIRLPQLYPLINEPLKALTPYTYFWISAIATFVLWGITCLIAFHNPMELYFKKHGMAEAPFQDKNELINRMCDTVETDHQTITQLSDLIRKMQKGLPPEETSVSSQVMSQDTISLKNKPLRLKNYTTKPTNQATERNAEPKEKQPTPRKLRISHASQEKKESKTVSNPALPASKIKQISLP